jgi:hypothetical protein
MDRKCGEGIKTTDHPATMVATAFGGNPVVTNQPEQIRPNDTQLMFPTITPETNIILPGVPDVAKVVHKVFMACYQHIFANCKMLINSDVGFQNPEFVLHTPIDLNTIPGAKEIIVGADINDPQTGNYQSKVPLTNGLLFGNLKKKTMLPGYTLLINAGGEYSTRALIPQNPATGSTTAIRARAGNAIMWIIDGAKARDDGGRWKFKPLKGIVVGYNKDKAVILCENGNKLTTKRSQEIRLGVDVEIFLETDTLKITRIRKFIPDREESEEKSCQPKLRKIKGDITDQDYYDRQYRYSPTNQ